MGKWSSRKRYNDRKAAGLCTRCGAVPPKDGILLCAECSESEKARLKSAEYHKRYIRKETNATKKRRLAARLCENCGLVPPCVGKRMCTECAAKRNARDRELVRERLAAGLCHCGNERAEGYSCCQGCIDRQRKNRKRRIDSGICTRCQDPVQPNRTHCSRHLLEMQLWNLDVLPEEKQRARLAAESFDGVCQNPRCGATNPGSDTFGWYLDHDHETKTFRGILCLHCNSLLGYARDNCEILMGAIEYLEEHRGRVSSARALHSGQPQLDFAELR